MEHDSSRSGYHEPEPGSAGLPVTEEDWGDDFPKTFSVNLIWAQARDRTWESLDAKYRPLPNRDNIVVSHDPMYRAPGATVVNDLDDALDLARQEAIPDDGLDRSEIWVIGGAQLFEEAMPFADKAYVTQLAATFDADVYAPDMEALVEAGLWHELEVGPWSTPAKPESGIESYRFVTYAKTR